MFLAVEIALVAGLGDRRVDTSCSHVARRFASQCLPLGGDSYVVSGWQFWLATALTISWFVAVHCALQGWTGLTPGKALLGIRVVSAEGSAPGFRAALVRSLLWVVDGFPFLLGPVIGGVAMVSTPGHQRVGDRAAQTWVVGPGAATHERLPTRHAAGR